MSDHSLPPSGRRSFLGRLGLVAALASAAAATKAVAQTARQRFEPRIHDEDAWMDMPGTHRTLIDCYTGLGGVNAMNYAANILSTHTDVYKGAESDYAMIICFRAAAAPLAYSDAMWEKYGKVLADYTQYHDPKTGENFPRSPITMSDRVDLPSRVTRWLPTPHVACSMPCAVVPPEICPLSLRQPPAATSMRSPGNSQPPSASTRAWSPQG